MQANLFGLAVLALAAIPSAATAANIPSIDEQATCRAAARTDPTTARRVSESCVRSEREARDRLVANWDGFRHSDRDYCSRLATMAGMGSYVQLLTCLEMERDVRVLRETNGDPALTTGSGK